jgi:uncharacterized repeat protein (TIGR01451 family)
MRRIALAAVAAACLLGVSADRAPAQGTADLAISKVADHKTVTLGETVTYTVIVTNVGPDAATGVVFGDPIPDQLNLVDSTCGAVSAFCTVESLASGERATLTIVATPIPNLARGERRIENTAFVMDSATTDPNPSNDQASVTVRVVGPLSR